MGYREFLVLSSCATFEVRYLLNNELIGVAVVHRADNALSAVYCYYDPLHAGMSLGSYSILKQVELPDSRAALLAPRAVHRRLEAHELQGPVFAARATDRRALGAGGRRRPALSAGALFNPAGGLRYHLRAYRHSARLWQPFRWTLGEWLLGWRPPETTLALFGPSGGYCLQPFLLERFAR